MKKIAIGSVLILTSVAVILVTGGMANAGEDSGPDLSLEFPETFPTTSISSPELPGIVLKEGLGYTVPEFDVLLRPRLPMTESPLEVSKEFPGFNALSPQMPTFVTFPSWEKPHGVDIPNRNPPGPVILPPEGGNCCDCDPGQGEWGLQYYGPTGSEGPVLSDTEVTIVFGEDGMLYGCAGCNQYFASYELGPDNSLEIGQ